MTPFARVPTHAVGEHFERWLEFALQRCADLQPWPGHFVLKKVETEILLESFGIEPHARGLEVGCGNGFQSSLLSCLTGRLVATDLWHRDLSNTHSVGLQTAKELLGRLEVDNVDLTAASATALPFRSEAFDYVVSSNTLEHVAERREALREIHRVLKPKGRFVVVVPTHVASLCAFPRLPLYVGVRAAQIMSRRLGRNRGKADGWGREAEALVRHRDAQRSVATSLRAFRANHPSFPLPEPHGTYPSIFHELVAQTPGRWARLIERADFRIEQSRAVVLIPISLIEVFSSRMMAEAYRRSRQLHVTWGGLLVARYSAFAWGALCSKR